MKPTPRDTAETDADERAWDELAARALRPARANLARIDAALDGVASADEAWEVLAARGLIPLAWARHPARLLRRFRDPHVPPTVSAARLLAADVPGIERAEVLAREVVARLAPWGVALPDSVRWKFLESDPAEARGHRMPLRAAAVAAHTALDRVDRRAAEALRARGLAVPDLLDGDRMVLRLVLDDFIASRVWRAAASRGGVVPSVRHRRPELVAPRELFGTPFGELPDPFEPALELWRTGYMLGAVDPDAIVLIAG